jgi:predicted metal-dependent phosphoesterase TrpH
MNDSTIDLHLHTTCSHGRFSPTRVMELASKRGLSAIAITDHNTAAGLCEARHVSGMYGVELIGGCEFSAEWQSLELHVLGLFLEERMPGFDAVMEQVATLWRERLERMMERVRRADGIELTWDDLYYTGHVPGVSPVAEAIARKRGDVSTGEAFRAYLDEGKPGYVAPLVDVAWVVRTVHDLGGLCVMAHPWAYNPEVVRFSEADYRGMKEMGVDGLECYHPGQPVEGLHERIALTRKLGMAVSGGSDCHGAGPGQPIRMGSLHVPASLLDEMRERLRPKA